MKYFLNFEGMIVDLESFILLNDYILFDMKERKKIYFICFLGMCLVK